MQTMQDFHNWLFSKTEADDPYKKELVRLSQISMSRLATIISDMGWAPWDVTKSETVQP